MVCHASSREFLALPRGFDDARKGMKKQTKWKEYHVEPRWRLESGVLFFSGILGLAALASWRIRCSHFGDQVFEISIMLAGKSAHLPLCLSQLERLKTLISQSASTETKVDPSSNKASESLFRRSSWYNYGLNQDSKS
ncbi:hypothetical protein B0H63DRAFT_449805 [Podospora didyma]|uniref:Uncharacterized protein n=1 Tax=Podospora didyma TaxID=330526 RepID=A0AAE0NQE0_9PEZI|nr:hypothetical protein B0H63DRAFT_449805 [Podospora didyma]